VPKSAFLNNNVSEIELAEGSRICSQAKINASSLFAPDTLPPSYSNLTESEDPLELGNIEVISINVTDPSGINQVLIEIEISNRSMTNVRGDKWQYSWTPSSTGNYTYIIHMEDKRKNWGFVEGSIQVVDTTSPTCRILTNHTSPLELGNSTTILIKATDVSGIKYVLFNYETTNFSMTKLGGDVWQFKNFRPSKVGTCNYEVIAEDYNDHKVSTNGSIEVQDTTSPLPPILIDFPQGKIHSKIIFDWEEVYDHSGIKFYRLIIDKESDPYITPGNIYEITIENTGPESTYYELYIDLPLGTYYFFLYQIDGVGLESSSSSGMFTIISPSEDIENNVNIIYILVSMGCAIVIVTGYIASKTLKRKEPKTFENQYESEDLNKKFTYLNNERKEKEREAKEAIKYGNYANASHLYGECKNISNDLFKLGVIGEQDRVKFYANMQSKAAQAQFNEFSIVVSNINELMIRYYKKRGLVYYSKPQIYPDGENTIDGLILDDKKFLQHRLINPKNGLKLVKRLNIDPGNIDHIKAIQFIYTNDLSIRNILMNCQSFQNPEMFLFIIGIKWHPSLKKKEIIPVPQDKGIIYQENIRIINSNLFANLIGLDDKYRDKFFKIITSNKKIESNMINQCDIEDLKEHLKKNRWFLLT